MKNDAAKMRNILELDALQAETVEKLDVIE
jgi:hypothetical protein